MYKFLSSKYVQWIRKNRKTKENEEENYKIDMKKALSEMSQFRINVEPPLFSRL